MCDLDGVVYVGSTAVPGAGAALGEIEDLGFRIVFATNAATRSPGAVADRIRRISGFETEVSRIVTSGMAAASMIGPQDQPVLAAGEEGLAQTLVAAGITVTDDAAAASCVVVGLDRSFSYERLDAAAAAARRGARLIAANTDATFPTPHGPAPGAGALVAAIETASGRAAEPAGKPHLPMIRAIRTLLGPGRTWVVGDRPETDLALASAAGWGSVLVLTGVTPDPGEVPGDLTPDHIVASLADLPDLLERQSP